MKHIVKAVLLLVIVVVALIAWAIHTMDPPTPPFRQRKGEVY